MIYGLYLSASGVMANSHRQDVIANNLANIETTGFKRTLALVQQRRPESQESGRLGQSDPILDEIGGGLFLAPTFVDWTQGPLEPSNSPLHLAIFGSGYFAVKNGDQLRLTRNGSFMLNRNGQLILADGSGRAILNTQRQPIQLDPTRIGELAVAPDGTITVGGVVAAQIGVFDVPDRSRIVPAGDTLLAVDAGTPLRPSAATVRSGFLEGSNVDPATEMTQLLAAQRQLEANANMIRFQDQSLSKLVNEVGKIG